MATASRPQKALGSSGRENYSLWLQVLRGSYFRPVAKSFQLSQARIYLAFPVELIVIISSKILENYTILEHVVYRCQHGMSNSDIGSFFSTMSTDPLKLCIEIRVHR